MAGKVTHWDGPPLEAWDPWLPEEAAVRLAGIEAPWCVVGGWAIDLFLGEQTRAHGDLEISIPRSAFPEVRGCLSEFQLYVVGDGEVRALARHGVQTAVMLTANKLNQHRLEETRQIAI